MPYLLTVNSLSGAKPSPSLIFGGDIISLIDVKNLTFAYDGSYDNVFENVSFQIDTDWKLGFTGRNGRGKTTFLNLLLGEHEFRGSITSSVSFDYFPFEIKDKSKETIEIIGQIYPEYELWKICRELSLLDTDTDILYRAFDSLSGGEQAKVMLAVLFSKDNNFLLIDEPTNHLDKNARKIVSEYLNSKKGFILVSHDRAFLDFCTDHTLSINKTNIEIQKGSFSSWYTNKELSDAFESSENEKLKKEIKSLSEAAKRTAAWSDKTESSKIGTHAADRGFIGHKAAKMMKRSKATEERRDRAVTEKSALLKNIETADDLKISPLPFHKKVLAYADDFSLSFGDNPVFERVSFEICAGDRISLSGKNGSGKSSILKFLANKSDAKSSAQTSGVLQKSSGLIVSYVPQDVSNLSGNLRDFAKENNIDESLFKALLRKLDFSRLQFEKDMADFSGGQKKKVALAKSLCEKAHLYIWDEPLNFVDILSRIQIENLILKCCPTLIFVEHDAAFSENIATKTVEL